jgi:hypothetical protein
MHLKSNFAALFLQKFSPQNLLALLFPVRVPRGIERLKKCEGHVKRCLLFVLLPNSVIFLLQWTGIECATVRLQALPNPPPPQIAG